MITLIVKKWRQEHAEGKLRLKYLKMLTILG